MYKILIALALGLTACTEQNPNAFSPSEKSEVTQAFLSTPVESSNLSSYDFGNGESITLGSAVADKLFTLSKDPASTSPASSTVSLVSADGAFAVVTATGCNRQLAKTSDKCYAKVRFLKNRQAGTYSATLSIGDESPLQISLTATVVDVAPALVFSEGSNPVGAMVDFGSLAYNQSVDKVFSVKNQGVKAVTPVSSWSTPSSQFYKVSDTCSGVSLKVGSTCYIRLAFKATTKPAVETLHQAVFSLDTVNLSVQGKELATLPPGSLASIKVYEGNNEQSVVDYGLVAKNVSLTKVLTLKNMGSEASAVSVASVTGDSFKISTNSCSTSLGVGKSCYIRLVFSSGSGSSVEETKSGSLVFANLTMNLSGRVEATAAATYVATFAYPANNLQPGGGSQVVSATGIATCRVQPANTLVANDLCNDQLSSAPIITQVSPAGDKIYTTAGGQANIPMLAGENWSIKPLASQHDLIGQYLICEAAYIKDNITCEVFDVTGYVLSKPNPRLGEWITVELQGYVPASSSVVHGTAPYLESTGVRKRFNVRFKPTAPSLTDSILATASFSSFTDSIMLNITGSAGYPEVKITSFGPSLEDSTHYAISGYVTNLAYLSGSPTGYRISVCVNTSEFYCQSKTSLNADGTFTVENYNAYGGLNFGDRLNVLLTTNAFAATINPEAPLQGHADSFVETNNKFIVPHIPNGTSIISYVNLYSNLGNNLTGVDPQIDNILSHLEKMPRTAGTSVAMSPSPRLVRSFLDIDNFALYDQALAIYALTRASVDPANVSSKAVLQSYAKQIMNALVNLEAAHGNGGYWYFSYNQFDDNGPYPDLGDRRMAGAISWVLMSMSYYKTQYPTDTSYDALLDRVRNYLLNQTVAVSVNGVNSRAVKFNPTDLTSTAFNESLQISLEHNLDLYAALKLFSQAYPGHAQQAVTSQRASEVRAYAESLWNNDTKRFYPGSTTSGVVNTNEIYLDTQSWGILALGTKSLDQSISYRPGLETNCRLFFDTAGYLQNTIYAGVSGFYDHVNGNLTAPHKFVWTEGTLGHLSALNRVSSEDGINLSCSGFSKEALKTEVLKLKNTKGGMPYATSSLNADFSTSESISGTAWLYFLNKGFNPFNP